MASDSEEILCAWDGSRHDSAKQYSHSVVAVQDLFDDLVHGLLHLLAVGGFLGGIVEGVRYRVGLQEVQDARLVVVRQRNVEIAACEDQIQHLCGIRVARVPVGQCVIVVQFSFHDDNN